MPPVTVAVIVPPFIKFSSLKSREVSNVCPATLQAKLVNDAWLAGEDIPARFTLVAVSPSTATHKLVAAALALLAYPFTTNLSPASNATLSVIVPWLLYPQPATDASSSNNHTLTK